MPYGQKNAPINETVDDKNDPRYGMPKSYKIEMVAPGGGTRSTIVHWSRVLHVAEDLLENNVKGIPALESVYNRLLNLELLAGGSAEMYWRGAFPGYAFELHKDATIGSQDATALREQIEKYIHKLERYLRVQGMEVKELAQQVVDPEKQVSVQLDLICAARQMPKRILMGSERGELASTDDRKQWNGTVAARQTDHCESHVVRPFIGRNVDVGALPEPDGEFTVNWPDITAPGAKERAEVANLQADTIKKWIESGAIAVLPPLAFFREVLQWPEEVIDRLVDEVEALQVQDDEPMEPVEDPEPEEEEVEVEDE